MEAMKEVVQVFGGVAVVLVFGAVVITGMARLMMFLFGVQNN